MSSIKLDRTTTAGAYVNEFMCTKIRLDKLPAERFSDYSYKKLFLQNIQHPDYLTIRGMLEVGLDRNTKTLYEITNVILCKEFHLECERKRENRERNHYDSHEGRRAIKKRKKFHNELTINSVTRKIHVPAKQWRTFHWQVRRYVIAYNRAVQDDDDDDNFPSPPNGVTLVKKRC